MKIRVCLTVEVDPAAWELAYGTFGTAIREDVREYVVGQVRDSATASEGAVKDVQIR